jgi:hypothetical protein
VLAYEIGRDPADLAAAKDIARWPMDFMRAPSGAFYTSQDADAGKDLHGDAFYAKTAEGRRAGPQPRSTGTPMPARTAGRSQALPSSTTSRPTVACSPPPRVPSTGP